MLATISLLLLLLTPPAHAAMHICPAGHSCHPDDASAYACADGFVSPPGVARCCPAHTTCRAGAAVDGDRCGCRQAACESPGDALVIAPLGAGLVCVQADSSCSPGMALDPTTGTCLRVTQLTCREDGERMWATRLPLPVRGLSAISTLSFLCMPY